MFYLDTLSTLVAATLVLLLGRKLVQSVSFLKKPRYSAELTFVLEDSKGSALSSYAGLASQFGIDLGGASASSGVFSGDNIMEFLKSRLMVEKALLSPLIHNKKVQSLADYYIEFTEKRESWDNKAELKGLTFPITTGRSGLTMRQDSVLGVLYEEIVKNYLSVTKPDKTLSFISVKCTTKDPIFSKTFTERLVKEATDFYIMTKTQRSLKSVNTLQAKADSLEFLLNRKTFAVAAQQDLNFNPARNKAGVSNELLMRDKIMLQTMYGEVVKNLELSRMAMAQETPLIQVVDVPILPLKELKIGKIKAIIIGSFVAGFLMMVWLLFRQISVC